MEFIFLLRGRETIAEHLGSKEHFGERGTIAEHLGSKEHFGERV